MTIPLVRVRYLAGHVRAYTEMGGDADRALRSIGVPSELLETPSALLPLSSLEELSRRVVHDVGLGLSRHAAPRSLDDFGSFGVLLASAASLFDALQTFVTAAKSEGARTRFSLESRPDALWFCWSHELYADRLLRAHVERFNVWATLAIIRHWAGPRWFPAELWLRTGPVPEDEELRAIDRLRYQAPISAISISHQLLARSAASPRPGLVPHELVDLDAIDLIEATSHVLETYLPTGCSTVVTLAEVLGLSTRSLQRRLSEVGTTHSQVLEDVRRRLALTRIEQRDRSIADIACDLGYSDPAHFTRAFRRWFGISPREFRRARQRA